MSDSLQRLPLIDLRADDAEIERYAVLLDSLGVALIAFAGDRTPRQRNASAEELIGDGTSEWFDENGRPLRDEERPELQVCATLRPVHQRAVGIRTRAAAAVMWCRASAFPVFAADGSLRRILLLLADGHQRARIAGDRHHLPAHDPYTGVFTQRYIEILLDDESRRAQRYGTPFAVALIGIDHFATRCQTEGEERVLERTARLLCRSLREFDMIGRHGADRFLVILPNVGVNEAMVGLERLRETIEVGSAQDGDAGMTISGGVSEYGGEDQPALVERLESLLASARDSGCNRLCVDLDLF
ncbi:GGDEF domain-containing protein [Accumulibacter sp.]|uniref:GGDEF domain-containing protein n=1 Tax=Accumulibacter sp. TaxID=2053492 RepID=UPI0025FD0E9D|nr:GGDEF domain-containing protein [Accumulibacter sp.]MCM8612488.1 GGDEF domain-containing protein [Accumulibacter sp.]MCM8636381.1 GGDEF domain-containing protein [Accumulibacter sp.]MCM8640089.1 GGDEF domain-containing protein [Accumulibacter sp.]